jgi:imidazolonepropionase-like amidohydrolase
MRVRRWAAGVGFVAALTGSARADELCLTGGRVVDPDRRSVEAADVVIAGDVIARVGAGAGATCRGRRVDLAGKHVMPGLIDLHVHGWGNPSPVETVAEEEPGRDRVLRLALRAGVMAVLDLAGDDDERLALRERTRRSPEHAHLYVALVAAGGSGAQVRARVRAAAARHADVIKVFPWGGAIASAVAEARRLGLPTVVHIDTWDDARIAVAAGASVITHLEDEVTIPRDLAAAMAARGVASMPTMAVQCMLARIVAQPARLDDSLLAAVTGPALRASYRDVARWDDKAREWLGWQRAGCDAHDFASLERLRATGVRLLAGSDTGNLGTFQGASLHDELELMVAAGVPAWDALRAATTEAARFLGAPWGVRAGAPANVIVVDGSPVDDVRATRRIARVIHLGRDVPLTR